MKGVEEEVQRRSGNMTRDAVNSLAQWLMTQAEHRRRYEQISSELVRSTAQGLGIFLFGEQENAPTHLGRNPRLKETRHR